MLGGKNYYPGVTAGLAHELAHIYQFRSMENGRSLWNGLLEVDNFSTRRRAELHADFLSGWCLGKLPEAMINSQNTNIAANKLYELGGFTPGDPNDHGSPQQRYACFLRGFFAGREDRYSIQDASDVGQSFVNAIVPLLSEP
jgi:hypothetical protein